MNLLTKLSFDDNLLNIINIYNKGEIGESSFLDYNVSFVGIDDRHGFGRDFYGFSV